MVPITCSLGWKLEVERGPNWLFVRPRGRVPHGDETPPLADNIWSLAVKNMTDRVVIELDDIDVLHTQIVGELLKLQQQLERSGGFLRICGLSEFNRQLLGTCGLDGRLPLFPDRHQAVVGDFPTQPR